MAMRAGLNSSSKKLLSGWRYYFTRMQVPMAVEIVSKETIKPSCPTPKNLRTFNLSLLDQLAPPIYSTWVLFYDNSDTKFVEKSRNLKKSLPKTLTKFYPFAGRLKDGFSVDCSDQGVEYIEANVAEDMSMVLKQPQMQLVLRQLLPCNQYVDGYIGEQAMLAVQMTQFCGGGVAIGVSIDHRIADGLAFATFMKTWATISCGDAPDNSGDFVFECTSIFPPLKDLSVLCVDRANIARTIANTVVKRFVFDESKISALKEKVASNPFIERPTRVEAVSAFLWSATIDIAKQRNQYVKTSLIVIPVEFRRRMKSCLPPHCIGNIFHPAAAQATTMQTNIGYDTLVKKIRDSIAMVTNKYTSTTFSQSEVHEYIKGWKNYMENWMSNCGEEHVFVLTSLCRYPLYEADFGWGRPIWVAKCQKFPNYAMLVDTKDGKGIEAWVGLLEEDMEKLELDYDFLQYVSSIN